MDKKKTGELIKDALQIVRAQARARRRTILECAVFALVIGALFVRLYCGFLTNRIYFGEYSLYHDWVFIALILLIIGFRYMVPARPAADTPLLHRWILIIWGYPYHLSCSRIRIYDDASFW